MIPTKYIQNTIKIILVLFLTGQLQAKEINTDMDGVLAAGGQMANMRHILEVYAMLGVGVEYKTPKKILQKAVDEYENTLNEMEKGFQYPEIRTYVTVSRQAWKPLKEKIETAFGETDSTSMKKSAQFIHDNIRHVIVELSKMKKFLLQKSSKKEQVLINASIEIGASIKRLSAHYMMKAWGLSDPTIVEHWDNGVKIYTDSIAILKESSFYNDANFQKLLNRSQKKLNYFNTLWEFDDKYMPVLVAKKSKKAFKEAQEILKLVLKKQYTILEKSNK